MVVVAARSQVTKSSSLELLCQCKEKGEENIWRGRARTTCRFEARRIRREGALDLALSPVVEPSLAYVITGLLFLHEVGGGRGELVEREPALTSPLQAQAAVTPRDRTAQSITYSGPVEAS